MSMLKTKTFRLTPRGSFERVQPLTMCLFLEDHPSVLNDFVMKHVQYLDSHTYSHLGIVLIDTAEIGAQCALANLNPTSLPLIADLIHVQTICNHSSIHTWMADRIKQYVHLKPVEFDSFVKELSSLTASKINSGTLLPEIRIYLANMLEPIVIPQVHVDSTRGRGRLQRIDIDATTQAAEEKNIPSV
jgi:hypothetical protein